MTLQKKMRKQAQITEKIQVGCMWKLIGIFDNRHGHPNRKLLSNAKDEIKHVTVTEECSKDFGANNTSETNIVASDIDGKNVTKLIEEDGETNKSIKLFGKIEVSDSNGKLFQELLQDPNSLSVKEPTRPLHGNKLSKCGIDAIPIKCQKLVHNVDKSLLERIKSKCGCPLTDIERPCTSDSIVILKPIQKEHGSLESSNVPAKGTNSQSGGQKMNLSSTVSCSNQRDLEAKRHLSRRLRTMEIGENITVKEEPRTLRSILSSPLSSPEYDDSTNFSLERNREKNSSWLRSEEVPACSEYMELDNQLQNIDSEAKIIETAYSTDHLDSEAYANTMEANNTIQSEGPNLSEMPSKQTMFVVRAENNSSTTKMDSHSSLNFSPIVTSPNHVTISESESEDNVKEKEHLSPVSVLDAPFSEDATNQPAKPPMRPLHLDFDEESEEFICPMDSKGNFDICIRTVLQATGLHWDELSKKSGSSGQLPNPSSFDEHLFSDFIKDILLELNQHNTSYMRPDTRVFSRMGKNFVKQIAKELHWYLVPSQTPRTLEHLMKKDLEKSVSWSSSRVDIEEIVFQIVDYMLVESIMQTILLVVHS